MNTTPLFIGDENGLRSFEINPSNSTLSFLVSMPELRRRHGLTRRMLAEKVGVSSEMILALEVGRRKPSEELEFKLREALK